MWLGVALMHAGDPVAAREHLERSVAMRERLDAPESPWLAQARLYLAQSLYGGDRAGARRILDLAAAAHRQQAVLGPQHHDLLTQTRTLIARTGKSHVF